MGFLILRFLYLVQFFGNLHHYSPNAENDDLSLNYDRESELGEQCCLAQQNGNRHYAGAKAILQSENADFLGEDGRKGAGGIEFQLPRQAMPNNY